jgi:hypothetical protein
MKASTESVLICWAKEQTHEIVTDREIKKIFFIMFNVFHQQGSYTALFKIASVLQGTKIRKEVGKQP